MHTRLHTIFDSIFFFRSFIHFIESRCMHLRVKNSFKKKIKKEKMKRRKRKRNYKTQIRGLHVCCVCLCVAPVYFVHPPTLLPFANDRNLNESAILPVALLQSFACATNRSIKRRADIADGLLRIQRCRLKVLY